MFATNVYGRRVSSQQPVSRRERPSKPALSREGIVRAAVAILRSEGLERLTMRRLARELDTGAASLYVYFRDTQELHAALLDELLGAIDPGVAAGPGDWRDRLWALVGAYSDALYAQPALARVALVRRLSGPHYLAVVDVALGLLLEGGVEPRSASWAIDLVLLVATASAVEHGSRAEMPAAAAQHEALVAVLAGAGDRYPGIAAVGEHLVSGTPAARSRWAFDLLLNGALHTAVPG
jgi:AcrR family transcriptional regulator